MFQRPYAQVQSPANHLQPGPSHHLAWPLPVTLVCSESVETRAPPSPSTKNILPHINPTFFLTSYLIPKSGFHYDFCECNLPVVWKLCEIVRSCPGARLCSLAASPPEMFPGISHGNIEGALQRREIVASRKAFKIFL